MSDVTPTQTSGALANILAGDRDTIPYRPNLNSITGSVTASIMLQQIIYWGSNLKRAFYKFNAPCNHDAYRPGDSWEEELGFTRYELTGALKRMESAGLTKKITRGTNKAEAFARCLFVYYTDASRMTWYEINWTNIEKMLYGLYGPNVENQHYLGNETDQHYLENEGNPQDLETAESDITFISETTTETTTETTKNGAAAPKRVPTGRNAVKAELETHFCNESKRPPPKADTPKQRKAAGELFWNPLLEIYDACADLGKAKSIITWSIAEMDRENLTIYNPNSIKKVALAEIAKRKRNGGISTNGKPTNLDRTRAAAQAIYDQYGGT